MVEHCCRVKSGCAEEPSPCVCTCNGCRGDTTALAVERVELLDEIVRCASPALSWDKEKSDAWLPGLWDALAALKSAEDARG